MNEGRDDVRLGKLVSLEKQWLPRGLGEGVGEAISEVKSRRMTTLYSTSYKNRLSNSIGRKFNYMILIINSLVFEIAVKGHCAMAA